MLQLRITASPTGSPSPRGSIYSKGHSGIEQVLLVEPELSIREYTCGPNYLPCYGLDPEIKR